MTEFLDGECARRRSIYVTETDGGFLISDRCAAMETRFMQSLIIRSVLWELAGTSKDITRRHVEDVLSLLGKSSGRQIDLPYSLRAEKMPREVLICIKKEARDEARREEILPVPGKCAVDEGVLRTEICANDGRPIPRNMYTKAFDYDKIKGILKLRGRLPGDFIVINPDGRRKSFSDYLTDIKAERAMRDKIPVVACGQEILWAIGYRSGESCRIDEHTKQILTMTFDVNGLEE